MAYLPKINIEPEYDTDSRYDYTGYINNLIPQLTGLEKQELSQPSDVNRPAVIIDNNAEYYQNFFW